jgi:ComF family protein
MVYQRLQGWQDWLFPRRCLTCLDRIGNGKDFCPGCERSLPYLVAACPLCAAPLEAPGDLPCGRCLQKPPPFERAIALFRYQDPVARLIQDLKYNGRLHLARTLGEMLAERLAAPPGRILPERVLPVPLHRARLRRRGYNQALELARPVARRLGLTLDYRTLTRVRDTAPQTELPFEQRARNVRKAFAARAGLNGARVALVDDVMTSGHTAAAAAQALRKAGAASVELWVVARAGH